jgi:carbamoyl-phosphate synthase small subunit
MKGMLVLEDGRVFAGEAFGASGTRIGEVCFNTSMTGYQEVLTDPSYYGQIVAMTYPLIGNYGVNPADEESARPQVRGFVIEELSELPSSWRATTSLPEYLAQNGVCGLQGIDTRSLTRHLRERGAMKACLTSENLSVDEARRLANAGDGVLGMDFVQSVTTPAAYDWDPQEQESGRWQLSRGGEGDGGGAALPPVKYHIVAYDYGLKRNILRRLRQHGFQVRVVPAGTPATDVLALNPDGIFLGNGPGDPAALDYAHRSVRELLGRKPIFGICLGHQLLGFALGGKTFKLKFGHHGGNQPVQDLATGRVDITSQNHGFAVDPDSLPGDVEVTHLNLNDHTVEGLRHRSLPVFSVQYHPEAAPGPHDALHFFAQFGKLIDDWRKPC